jgi:hypothetical protein
MKGLTSDTQQAGEWDGERHPTFRKPQRVIYYYSKNKVDFRVFLGQAIPL